MVPVEIIDNWYVGQKQSFAEAAGAISAIIGSHSRFFEMMLADRFNQGMIRSHAICTRDFLEDADLLKNLPESRVGM